MPWKRSGRLPGHVDGQTERVAGSGPYLGLRETSVGQHAPGLPLAEDRADAGPAESGHPPSKETDPEQGKTAKETAKETGTVLLPPRASGHRIFVDGRRFKMDGDGPLRLRCGSHVVQIGSSGTPETVDLPCGGELQLK